ncbi:hypothetical protein HK105_204677 [Polyrhizophydium stewartii]|uniref:Tyrosine specific protein phosphatases domain-containing protein n=1 Tax=Polyrhizophydium stewartii TaxID=2732419 RepID=A0ABR4N869_9FUNG
MQPPAPLSQQPPQPQPQHPPSQRQPSAQPARPSAANAHGAPARLPNQPTPIDYKHLRFLVFDAPSDRVAELYLRELLAHGVTDVVRVCDPTYDKALFEAAGIRDLPFPDGEAPPDSVVQAWLQLVAQRFSSSLGKDKAARPAEPTACVGVHCVAGLGRAPVLVAMALIEAGMAPLDSVIYIRERRRGAINARQLKFLEAYKRRSKDKACLIQ